MVDVLGEAPKKDISPNNAEPKKRAHVQRACICGSTTHQRRSSYLCPLNCRNLVTEVPVCLPIDQPTGNTGTWDQELTKIFWEKNSMKSTSLKTIPEHTLYVDDGILGDQSGGILGGLHVSQS